ncbi:hypothetical protein [Cytobacillus firmus]|uniref:Membrane-associated phospholipid phosphatase n=1 Tax=Cytobacillus firmus TaxID=1399 RepID=A0AA46P0E7_CYTFI|nr:hypothetical protein [Cytobacillus firmus]KML41368.1 hypothetical protein VL14_10920 [Cytobacillus firmus]MCU1806824.1 hypothetical protein [Cytobacillus firmus]UYG94097.1 hypothetical protein OD459_18080 [Cytobacillus firmus]WHY33565.1 hypothetical protein QNH44_21535 [Cytobacillus firmus]
MDPLLFAAFTAGYILLFIWAILIVKNSGPVSAAFLLPVILGLIYDNGILAAGSLIGEGNTLKLLNYARFWIHAFFTPLLVLYSWHTLKQADIVWAKTGTLKGAAYLLTAGLILLELFTEVFGLELEAKWEYGVLSYSNAEAKGGPPIMVLIISAVLLAASVFIWRKQGWFWFFAGSVLMIIGSVIDIPVESAAAVNAFEWILLLSLTATAYFQKKRGLTKT